MESMLAEVERLYGLRVEFQQHQLLLEIFLIFGVSQYCEDRAIFLNQIMEMKSEIQAQLMCIIQSSKYTVIQAEADALHTDRRYIHHRSDEATSELYCQSCQEKEFTIQNLRQEILEKVSHEQETERQLKESLQLESSKTIDVELSLLEKEEVIREKDRIITEISRKLLDNENKINHQLKIENTIVALQDEVDILRPKADRLTAVEAQVEKLRARLEDAQEVKHQLAAETASHAKTHASLMTLVVEIESLRKNKLLVDQYRDQLAELTIEKEDLTRHLRESARTVEQLKQANESLSAGQQERLLDTRTLSDELQMAQQQLRELEKGHGIGEGLTELNPVLRQELDLLRSETQLLRERLSMTSPESVELMEAQLADQKCMTTSLQGKWADTKARLQEAQLALQSKDKELEQLKQTESLLRSEVVRITSLSQEENRHREEQVLEERTRQQRRWQAALSLQYLGRSRLATEWQQADKLSANHLAAVEESLSAITFQKSVADSELTRLSEELEALSGALALAEQQREEIVREAAAAQKKQLQEAQRTFEREKLQQQEAFRSALAVEASRVGQMQAELDEETMKRRKAERVKKFYEAEAQRHKTQLQVAASSSTGGDLVASRDMECVIKELKRMQQELDEANAEISSLRSKGHHNVAEPPQVAAESGIDELAAMPSLDTAECISSNRALNSSSSGTSLKGPSRVLRSIHHPNSIAMAAGGELDLQSDGFHQLHLSSLPQPQQPQFAMSSFLEQAELSDKRIDLLTREKREMISKTLEENKEKMELSQKLLLTEKEVASLRAELRKATLERERAERKLMLQQGSENAIPKNTRLFSQI